MEEAVPAHHAEEHEEVVGVLSRVVEACPPDECIRLNCSTVSESSPNAIVRSAETLVVLSSSLSIR